MKSQVPCFLLNYFVLILINLITVTHGQVNQPSSNGLPRQVPSIVSVSAATASINDIYKFCYPRDIRGYAYPLGQKSPNGPAPLSMSSLIAILEQLEGHRDLQDPIAMARWLLSRFRIDDLVYYRNYRDFAQEPGAQKQAEILSIPLRLREAPAVHENILTDDQACLLYFMLSHTVNGTQPDRSIQNGIDREMGVVNVNHHQSHAVAPGRLLLAFLSTSTVTADIETGDIVNELIRHDPNLVSFKSKKLNPTFLSLADTWAGGVLYDKEVSLEAKKFGATGEWNTSQCSLEYRLVKGFRSIAVSKGSLAELRGSIDGILIGKKFTELVKSSSTGYNPRLSSLLRQYYSANGLGDQYTSYCSRTTLQGELSSNLREQAKGYLALLLTLIKNSIPSENDVNYYIDQTASDFESALQESQRTLDDDLCRRDPVRKNCETPMDVTFVLDIDNEFEQQVQIITKIATSLETWKWGSSITIVANTRGGGSYMMDSYTTSNDGLSRISWNTTDTGCTLCRLAFLDRLNFGGSPVPPDQLLRLANQTLRDIQQGKNSLSGAPARPLVIFNFGSIRRSLTDQRAFDSAYWDLRSGHRESSIFIVGKERETPEYMKSIATEVIDGQSPDPSGVASKLLLRMCQSSLVLQYPDCRKEASSGYSYNGFVSPNGIQYVAMFPEFFLKSYNVEFEISSPTGTPLRVCSSRGQAQPDLEDKNCFKIDKEPQAYKSKNPCYRYGLHDCPAYFWTIEGTDQTAGGSGIRCRDEKCSSLNQIPYKISHTGIACSSALTTLSLQTPYALILFIAIAVAFYNFV